MDWISHLREVWPVIKQAPLAFTLCLCLGLAAGYGLSTWYHHRKMSILEQRIALLKDQVEACAPTGQQAVSGDLPKFTISLLGGNIFIPEEARDITGIALDARIMNAGAPSIAADWKLLVIPKGRTPVLAQYTKVPETLRLGGERSSAVIRGSQSLGELTGRQAVQKGTAVDGVLLFYVRLPKTEVKAQSTIMEVSVRDIHGAETVTQQRIGDWLSR